MDNPFPDGGLCVQAVIPQAELRDTLQCYPAYSYVVDFSGDVVAALVSRPLAVTLPMNASHIPLSLCSMQEAGSLTRYGVPSTTAHRAHQYSPRMYYLFVAMRVRRLVSSTSA